MDLADTLDRFAPAIGRIAASYEANTHIREELIQDIGLAVWRALPNYTGKGSVKGYVLRIAHNKCVDHVAKEVNQNHLQLDDADGLPGEHCAESHAILNQRQQHLFNAIRQLSLPLRQVMTLLLEDMSYAEIAEALDIAPTNVGVRVNRAKQQLKELLQS